MVKKRVLLLVLPVLALLFYGCAAQEVPIPKGVPQVEERLPAEAAELPKPEQQSGIGLSNLCSGEDECVSFCQNNPVQCQEYCQSDQENVLCQKYFGKTTIPEIDKSTSKDIPSGEMDSMMNNMMQEMMEQMMGGGAPSTTQKSEEVACDKTPTQRKFNTNPYYTGPLIDSHIHMPSAFRIPSGFAQQADWNPPVLDQDVSKAEIVCLFDKEGINYAFGFYPVINLMTGQSVQVAKKFDQQYPGRMIPFIMPPHVTDIDLKLDQIEEILNANKGFFKGYGEIGLYKGSFKGVSPDDPSLLEIYKIADKHNLIVMIHPDDGQRQAIERILKDYPNVIFLFHGTDNMGSYATDIVGKYPNAYFTIDTDLSDIPNERESVSLYDAKGGKEEFVFEFKRDYNKVLDSAITAWKDSIEKYPDKFLWGTDRASEMHFDPEVGALLEEIGRSFIGQLGPNVQEKFAYKNAERLLQDG
ncbi:MAG: amidohydrolase family protein [Nanoarchaeota archaeon]